MELSQPRNAYINKYDFIYHTNKQYSCYMELLLPLSKDVSKQFVFFLIIFEFWHHGFIDLGYVDRFEREQKIINIIRKTK